MAQHDARVAPAAEAAADETMFTDKNFDEEETTVRALESFDDLPIAVNLLRGVYSCGWERPSAIQQRAILPVLQGKDLLAQGQTGTGKTGAFAIGLLHRMDFSSRACQGMVLSPTRELAGQTERTIAELGAYLCEDDFTASLVGGRDRAADVARLRKGVLVAVGTPGRLLDLLGRRHLCASEMRTVVIDEADKMLEQGFATQLVEIFRFMPKDVQVCLFSATIPEEVVGIAGQLLRDPVRIRTKKERVTLDNVKQFYVAVEEDMKLATMIDLYGELTVAQSYVYCNTKRKAELLARAMTDRDFTVSVIHSELSQEERSRVLDCFRSGASRVLISTDVTSRGISIDSVSFVVNYDLPLKDEDYVHRVGRAGRFGRAGVAISFVKPSDARRLSELSKFVKREIEELPMGFGDLLG